MEKKTSIFFCKNHTTEILHKDYYYYIILSLVLYYIIIIILYYYYYDIIKVYLII